MSNFERAERRHKGRAVVALIGMVVGLGGVIAGLARGVDSTEHTNRAKAYNALLASTPVEEQLTIQNNIALEKEQASDNEREAIWFLVGGVAVWVVVVGEGNYSYYRSQRPEEPIPLEIVEPENPL